MAVADVIVPVADGGTEMRAGKTPQPAGGGDFKYWAFISYSHRDRVWGDWLHRVLETYRVPRQIRARPGRDGALPRRIMPVFRDKEELPTSANLGEAIYQALLASRYLIVICSTASARSIWVNEEVRNFKRMGRADRIMCLVIDGEPNATDRGDPAREAFCPALRYEVGPDGAIAAARAEPLAADVRDIGNRGLAALLEPILSRLDLRFRGPWLREARIKLTAGILGVDFDRLWQRERRRRFWRRVQASALALVVAAGGYAVWYRLAVSQSLELASKALESIEGQRYDEALKVILNAVPRDPDAPFARPLLPEVQAALDLAMIRNRLYAVLGGIRYETETIEMSADGILMATSSRDGTVRLWDTRSWRQTAVFFAFDAPPDGDSTKPLQPKADPERIGRPLALHPLRPVIAAATIDGRVMLFDTRSGAPVATLVHASGYAQAKTEAARQYFLIRSLMFDAGGERLLSAGEDGTVRIWDWQRGMEAMPALRHPAAVKAARFDPFGRFIATVCDDGATRLWDARTGALLKLLPGGGGDFATLRFDAAGTRLAVATNLRIYLWDTDNPRSPLPVAILQHEDAVRWIEFSPDNKLLASASDDGTARLWAVASGAQVARVEHQRSVRRALFDPTGRYFATVSEDRLVRVWDLEGKPLPGLTLRGHTHFVFAGAFTRDGSRLVTASSDMTLRVWDMTPRARGVVLQGMAQMRRALFMPDGKRVIAAGIDRRVMIFDAETGCRLDDDRFADTHLDRVNGLALSPEGDRFVTVSRDRTAKVWFLDPTRQPIVLTRDPNEPVARSHDAEVVSAAFSPDGKRIVTTSRDSTARLWNAETGTPIPGIPPLLHTDGKPVWGAVFSFDGRLVLTAGHDEQAGIWDAATGKNLRWLRPKEGRKAAINVAVFDRDAGLAATGSDDGTVRIWDVATGAQIGSPLRHDDQVVSLAFAPSGDYLVSGTSSGTIRFWRVSDHELLEIWYVHDGHAVRSIVFDRSGERILTAADDRTAQVWPSRTDRSRLLQEALAAGRRICRRTPETPEWSDVWRWCPADLAE